MYHCYCMVKFHEPQLMLFTVHFRFFFFFYSECWLHVDFKTHNLSANSTEHLLLIVPSQIRWSSDLQWPNTGRSSTASTGHQSLSVPQRPALNRLDWNTVFWENLAIFTQIISTTDAFKTSTSTKHAELHLNKNKQHWIKINYKNI